MAIHLNQQRSQKIKLPLRQIALVFVLLATIAAAWFFLFEKPRQEAAQNAAKTKKVWKNIEINFDILKNPIVNNLQDFQNIPDFGGKVGRDNPFK